MTELIPIEKGGKFEPPKQKPLKKGRTSQLALFTTKPNDANRWPRGYTPERMHAVSEAMPEVMSITNQTERTHLGGASTLERAAKVISRTPWINNSERTTRIGRGEDATAKARLVDILSRSRINPKDLNMVDNITLGPEGSHAAPPHGAAGAFNPDDGSLRILHKSGRIGAAGEHAITHELGHATDPDVYKDINMFDDGWGSELAHNEGVAEGYSTVNYVPHRNSTNVPHFRVYDTVYNADRPELNRLIGGSGLPDRSEYASAYRRGLSTWGVSPDSNTDIATKVVQLYGNDMPHDQRRYIERQTGLHRYVESRTGALSGKQWQQLSLFPDEYPPRGIRTSNNPIPIPSVSTYKENGIKFT